MVEVNKMVRAAALAGLACSGAARAAELNEVDGTLTAGSVKPVYLQEEEKGRKPLMSAVDRVGFAPLLDDLGIDISGHIEVSYTKSADNAPDDVLSGRVFDVQDDEFYLNQVDVAVARTLEPTDDAVLGYKDKLNVGFKMEWIYGYDARFIHSNGLFDHYVDDASRNEEFDLNQAYVTLGVPVGTGLLVTAGKFVTPLGYEYINPTLNPLYSHSYLFGFAIPFTHTGITAKYNFSETFYVLGGVHRGWEQSNEDNNDAESFLAQVGFTLAERYNFAITGVTGPEQADNESDYRTVIDLIISTALSDNLTVGINADYGYEEGAEINNEGIATGDEAQWYGVAAYGSLKLSDMFTVNARGEWFNDKDGSRGIGTNIYEATLGVAIKPFPNNEIGSNLVIRPEVRYDYAQEGFFDGATEHDQLTVAADVIFTF